MSDVTGGGGADRSLTAGAGWAEFEGARRRYLAGLQMASALHGVRVAPEPDDAPATDALTAARKARLGPA